MSLHAEPFTHLVLDDGLDARLVAQASQSWPARDWIGWTVIYNDRLQKKLVCNDWTDMPAPCRELLARMLLLGVPGWLGTPRSIPDTMLWGAGMCDMRQGDYLDVHLDRDCHPLMGMALTATAILFLSPWQEEWSGHLELWGKDLEEPHTLILPQPNRLVAFANTEQSYHGVSQPLACPPDAVRQSLVVQWYALPASPSTRPRAQFVARAA